MRTNGIDLLRAQHQRLLLLLEVVAADRDTAARMLAFDQFRELFAVHETAEDLILRPITQRFVPGGGPIAARRIAEETHARHALARLHADGLDSPEFEHRFARFRMSFLAHTDAEEREEFSAVRRGQEAGEVPALGDALEEHEHPAADNVGAATA